MNPSEEPFVGTWELDPSTLDYQFRHPGRRALYTIEAVPGGLRFTLDGDDADGALSLRAPEEPEAFRVGTTALILSGRVSTAAEAVQ